MGDAEPKWPWLAANRFKQTLASVGNPQLKALKPACDVTHISTHPHSHWPWLPSRWWGRVESILKDVSDIF
jgi:hypothetical protein